MLFNEIPSVISGVLIRLPLGGGADDTAGVLDAKHDAANCRQATVGARAGVPDAGEGLCDSKTVKVVQGWQRSV